MSEKNRSRSGESKEKAKEQAAIGSTLKKSAKEKVVDVSLSRPSTSSKAAAGRKPERSEQKRLGKGAALKRKLGANRKAGAKSASVPLKRGVKLSSRIQKISHSPKEELARKAKAAAAKQTIAKESGVKELTGKGSPLTPTPEFLTTPSDSALKSFRKATERNRKLAAQKKSRSKLQGQSFLAKPLKKGKKFTIDLRIHSPGTVGYFSTGGVDPGPALVRLSKVKGLDVIAITDYYNASYVDLVQGSAGKTGLTVLPGLVVCSRIGNCHEVYLVVLFPETTTGADIFSLLAELGVPKEQYGSRDYCLERDFGEIVQAVEARGGVVIPSRLDKTPYRQQVLTTLIEDFGFHAFDLVHPENLDFFADRWPDGEFSFFSFSNANALAQIGSRSSTIKLEIPGFAGLKEMVKRRIPNS